MNLDLIADGSVNRFIVNDKYDSDLTIDGTLYASNLIIKGDTTTINTNTYTTENLEIVSDAPEDIAFKIQKNGIATESIMTVNNGENSAFLIDSNGNIGIANSAPTTTLDVIGTIKGTNISGDGSELRNVHLADRDTSMLAEGTNLYYTAERVGIIVSSSNVETSNLIANNSNAISTYLTDTSNLISNRITDTDTNASNYVLSTSNAVTAHVVDTSNLISNRITDTDTNASNYVLSTSNAVTAHVIDTSNLISNRITDTDTNASNYVLSTSNAVTAHVIDTSNVISNRITNIGDDTSNYVLTTSNAVTAHLIDTSNVISNRITDTDTNASNYVLSTSNAVTAHVIGTSNVISNRITDTDTNASNYVLSTSNAVTAHVIDTSNVISNRITDLNLDLIADGSVNRFIVSDKYDSDLTIDGTLYASNLIIKGDTTTINTNTYTTENLEIVSDAPEDIAFKIQKNGIATESIMTVNNGENSAFLIDSNGNIGIANSAPTTTLDVIGTIKGTNISGDGSELRNVHLADRDTSMLAEGTNLYYTAERVGIIVSSSNVETSNLIANNSNAISTYLTDTSNLISNRITDTDTNASNYVLSTSNAVTAHVIDTSNLISNRITDTDTNASNYVLTTSNAVTAHVVDTSNVISNRITDTDTNASNYVLSTSNAVTAHVIDTSNVISNRITNIGDDTSNYVLSTSNAVTAHVIDTSNVISNRITDTDTNASNYVLSTSNAVTAHVIDTSNVISNRITDLNLDLIADGSVNRFIVSDKYDSDLTIDGTLYASNLIIKGDTTTINTNTYTTENLEIVSDAPEDIAFKIQKNGIATESIMTVNNGENSAFLIDSNGNIGIANSAPTTTLDVIGTIKGTNISGDGSELRNVHLADRDTSMLAEGTNLYYTAERVGIIVSSSNVETSNLIANNSNAISTYLTDTSNLISNRITDTDTNASNYVLSTSNAVTAHVVDTSNLISNRITDTDTNASNYVLSTSNAVTAHVIDTSNLISNRITDTDTNASNYVLSTSNAVTAHVVDTSNVISNRITDTDTNASNYVLTTSNAVTAHVIDTSNVISNRITDTDTNASNYVLSTSNAVTAHVIDTSNVISNRITNIGDDTSNYVLTTSNAVTAHVIDTSNVISNRITDTDTNASNYVLTTSNAVTAHVIGTSNVISNRITDLNLDLIADGSVNRFIINDNYDSDLTVDGTLYASNLIIIGDTTTINANTYTTENLEIVSDSPEDIAFKIQKNGIVNTSIMTVNNGEISAFLIDSNGNIGINNSAPTTTLDVIGTIKGTNISGDGSELRNVHLADRDTSMLAEGTNLYYTAERVGIIVSSSNVETSNLIANNSNAISTYLTDTSNLISNRITDTDTNSSNYVLSTSNAVTAHVIDTSNVISNRITDTDTNASNYVLTTSNAVTAHVIDTSNLISNRITDTDTNASNYVLSTSNAVTAHVIDTSNVISNRITDTDTNASNYVLTTSNAVTAHVIDTSNLISNRITDTDTNVSNYVLSTSNAVTAHVIDTSNVISNRITDLNLDLIADGSVNRFIVSDKYDSDLTIDGTLYASNLIIKGDTTTINTNTYTTENLEIVSDAPEDIAFKIQKNGIATESIMTVNNGENSAFLIDSNGNIGIANSAPTTTLDVIGTIKGTNISGDGSELRNVHLADRDTSMLAEGTNLYYTAERVGIIVSSSNVETSNLIANNSNAISSYLTDTSNLISNRITDTDTNASNYVLSTSNAVTAHVIDTSNLISNRITDTDTNASNYVLSTSNAVTAHVIDTSNLISNRITDTDTNASNYVLTTSNEVTAHVIDTSNLISNRITYTDTITSNYIASIMDNSNMFTMDNLAQGTFNKYIHNNIYPDHLMVAGVVMTTGIEIVDLDIILENSGTCNLGNFHLYIDHVTSNLLQNSNMIKTINTDLFKNGEHNKFVIDNAYDDTLTVNDILTVNSNINVSGDIIPNVNITYNLGSETNRWKDLYLSGNSIYLNNTILSSDPVTNTVSITDSSNSLVNLTVAELKVQDPITLSSSIIKVDNNKISINNYDSSLNLQSAFDISPGGITDNISEGSNLYYTDTRADTRAGLVSTASNLQTSNYVLNSTNAISTRITELNTDNIDNGNNNKYIVNNIYNDNISVLGTLSASNLIIIGESAVINTQIYTTENLEILSSTPNEPSIKLSQYSSGNILEAYDNDTRVVSILKNGNMGLGITNPAKRLELDGDLSFTGSINSITSTELNYLSGVSDPLQNQIDNLLAYTNSNINSLTTTDVPEGSRLYYTDARADVRAGLISTASNLITTNNVLNTTNAINTSIDNLNTSNLITTNAINTRIDNLNTSEIAEDASRLYYTDARADTRAGLVSTASNLITTNNVLNTTNAISTRIDNLNTSEIAEDASRLYYTDARADVRAGLVSTASNLITTNALNTSIDNLNTSNLITTNAINTRIDNLNTSEIAEDASRLYYTDARADVRAGLVSTASNLQTSNYVLNSSNVISARINTLNTDTLVQGANNKFIVNNAYDSDLTINGTLTASNLNVVGTTTTISTSTYQTEALEIITNSIDSPAITIIQNGTQNLLEAFDNTTRVVTILNNGNMGLGITNPVKRLELDGDLSFTGSINSITSTELNYLSGVSNPLQNQIDNLLVYTNSNISSLTTTDVPEGSRLYYTDARADARAGLVSTASNLITTNNVLNTTNAISTRIDNLNTSEIAEDASRLYYTDARADVRAGLVSTASNLITTNAINTSIDNLNTSNLITTNAINTRIDNLNTSEIAEDASRLYYTDARADVRAGLVSTASNLITTNNVLNTTNAISTRIDNLNTSEIAEDASRLYYTDARADVRAGLVSTASNLITTNAINTSIDNLNTSNLITTNAINTRIDNLNTSEIAEDASRLYYTDARADARAGLVSTASNLQTSNYVLNSSNVISARINTLNTDTLVQGTNNKFIVNNAYDSDLNIDGTLTASNLNVVGTTTTISTSTYQTEALEIITNSIDSPAITIIQNGTQNLLEAFDNTTRVVTILNNGNMGLGITNPVKRLELDGDLSFTGSINSITSTKLNYLSDVSGNIGSLISAKETAFSILPVSKGGTGVNTVVANRILYGNGTFALNSSASLTFNGSTFAVSGNITATGTIAGVASSKLTYLSDVSGNIGALISGKEPTITTLPVTKGGTGLTTVSANQLLYGNGTGALNSSTGLTYNSSALAVTGDITATGDIIASYSDMRLKDEISEIIDPIQKIKQLRGFYYTANDIAKQNGIIGNVVELGLSAQDVQNVIPEIIKSAPFDTTYNDKGEKISKSGEKYLTIAYERLVPLLIEGIKNLTDRVEYLEKNTK